MFPVKTRYDVPRALAAGLNARQTEELTGVPPRSQRAIVKEEISFAMKDPELHRRQKVGRPTNLTLPQQQAIAEFLQEDVRLQVSEVLRRLRSQYDYAAGSSAVYEWVRRVRPKPGALPVIRFEGVAGEFAQHDFGTVLVEYGDATREKLAFYAGRLKYSRAFLVSLAAGESSEAYIRGMEKAALRWGGLPLLNVVDNTKAAVLKRVKDPDTGEERIHYPQQFATFLQEVGVFAEPAAPYAAQQKGAVENLVKFAKRGFFHARKFRHRADLERQLQEWLRYSNEERPCDATGVIPHVRLQEEQPRLRPVSFGARGYGLLAEAVVNREGWIRSEGYRYSSGAPVGQTVTVRVHPQHVVLHYQGAQAVHPRVPENGKYSLLPEHLAPRFVKPRGKIMAQRQILMDLGPDGEAFFTELVHRRPQTWRQQDLPVVWDLYETLGGARLQQGFAYCLARTAIGAEYLQAWATGMGA